MQRLHIPVGKRRYPLVGQLCAGTGSAQLRPKMSLLHGQRRGFDEMLGHELLAVAFGTYTNLVERIGGICSSAFRALVPR